MPYDTHTYGQSPFSNSNSNRTTGGEKDRASLPEEEPLSDQLALPATEALASVRPPTLPTGYAPIAKPKAIRTSLWHFPKGALTGMTIVGEAACWLMAWGTIGFFRRHIPPPVIALFDSAFSPWGMAALTVLSALAIGRRFHRYALKLAALKDMATTAIEHGEASHQADAQNSIYDLLTQAEADIQTLSAQAVSWLTALSALFIIGAFY